MKKRILITFFLLISVSLELLIAAPLEEAAFSSWAGSLRLSYLADGYPELIEFRGLGGDEVAAAVANLPERTFKPWTAQLRPAGFVNTPAGTVIAVNGGYPLLFKSDGFEFIHPDRGFTRDYLERTGGLTVGTVYADENRAGFHFYRDRFFDLGVSADDAEGAGPVVVELTAGELDSFSLSIPDYSFAAEHPGWEPVEYIHKEDGSLIAWKFSDEKKTRFRYIIHDAEGGAVDEIDETYFRDEYNLNTIDSGPFALRGFIRAVREGAAGMSLQASSDIYLKLTTARAGSSAAVYYSKASAARGTAALLPVQLQACFEGETWYILNDGEVFVCGSNITRWELPALPEGFKYTDILVEHNSMLLCWEESRFPFIGRSGMILIRMRDILN
ncbi:MAG TPA: hypothetical protein DCO79_13005 [Spirochaeta sp.]|nr:hypothetical protein [Spirochaeta sp.]